MIEVSTEYPQDVIRGFVGERIGVEPESISEPSVGAAVLQDKKLIGGVVFHNYHVLKKG